MYMDIFYDSFYILDEYGKFYKILGFQDFDIGCSVQYFGYCWIGLWLGILKKEYSIYEFCEI